jgi:anti-sigma factor RsiW
LEQHCSEEVLSAYLDGDLEAEVAGATAEHLAECEVCRQSLADVRAVRDAAPAMEELVPPDRVWRAIRDRIQGSRSRRRSLMRACWVGVPALAALLVVFLAGGFGHWVRVPPGSPASGGRASAPGVAVAELSRTGAAEQTAREYGEYVRGIDRAIEECRAAMEENPGNLRVRAAYAGASINRQRVTDRLGFGEE